MAFGRGGARDGPSEMRRPGLPRYRPPNGAQRTVLRTVRGQRRTSRLHAKPAGEVRRTRPVSPHLRDDAAGRRHLARTARRDRDPHRLAIAPVSDEDDDRELSPRGLEVLLEGPCHRCGRPINRETEPRGALLVREKLPSGKWESVRMCSEDFRREYPLRLPQPFRWPAP